MKMKNTGKKVYAYLLIGTLISVLSFSAGTIFGKRRFSLDRLDTDEKIRRVTTLFHKVFYSNKKTLWQNKWLGIGTLQNPNDVWITQEIIYETKPDFIVETGTYLGGSALLWAMILEQVNPDGKVITIDIKDLSRRNRQHPLFKKKVEFILGGSTDEMTINKVKQRVKGKKVLVILDSLHTKSHVLEELNLYSPFIPKGGYIIVQDSNVNGNPVLPDFGPGPMEAILAFLNENKKFKIDLKRQRLLLTLHPNGFLRRTD